MQAGRRISHRRLRRGEGRPGGRRGVVGGELLATALPCRRAAAVDEQGRRRRRRVTGGEEEEDPAAASGSGDGEAGSSSRG